MRVLHVSVGGLVAVLERGRRAAVAVRTILPARKLFDSLRVHVVLVLVVPRVDHGAALGEVQVAVSVAELLGLRRSVLPPNVKVQVTHEEVAGRASDADHDEREGVQGRVLAREAVHHGRALLDVLRRRQPVRVDLWVSMSLRRFDLSRHRRMKEMRGMREKEGDTDGRRSQRWVVFSAQCVAWEAAGAGGSGTHVGGETPGHVGGGAGRRGHDCWLLRSDKAD